MLFFCLPGDGYESRIYLRRSEQKLFTKNRGTDWFRRGREKNNLCNNIEVRPITGKNNGPLGELAKFHERLETRLGNP